MLAPLGCKQDAGCTPKLSRLAALRQGVLFSYAQTMPCQAVAACDFPVDHQIALPRPAGMHIVLSCCCNPQARHSHGKVDNSHGYQAPSLSNPTNDGMGGVLFKLHESKSNEQCCDQSPRLSFKNVCTKQAIQHADSMLQLMKQHSPEKPSLL